LITRGADVNYAASVSEEVSFFISNKYILEKENEIALENF
jgi:hypothetical protein